MGEKVLPSPDRYAVSPPADTEIFEFYDGVFESVYFLLSPFIKPISIPIQETRFTLGESRPLSKAELLEGAEPVRWSKVIELTKLDNINEVDIGLRTSILGLKDPFSNEDYADEISSLKDDIFPPIEGRLSKLLQNNLFRSIQELGYDWLWVGDEFCTERELHWIDDMIEEDLLGFHNNVFTPDKSLLITSHWDSHFSLLCSSRQKVESILEYHSFEGFFCEPGMTMYWSIDQSGS